MKQLVVILGDVLNVKFQSYQFQRNKSLNPDSQKGIVQERRYESVEYSVCRRLDSLRPCHGTVSLLEFTHVSIQLQLPGGMVWSRLGE